jgi:hypothetical protein
MRTFPAAALAALIVAAPATAAQPRGGGASTPTPAAVSDENARETRERLREILQQYPPSLTQVLQLDSSLLTKPDYLTPYPTLAAYLTQHPEIAHNPAYFIGRAGGLPFDTRSPRGEALIALRDAVSFVTVMLGFLGAFAAITYLGRALIDHRRWLGATKIQTDMHTKIVDRLSSNEDLMAYLQSPSGQRMLALAPGGTDVEPRSVNVGAPINRILWSMQTGIVVALGGLGLWMGSLRVFEELAQPLQIVALLAIALGIGFVISAAMAYVLSRHLGLVQPRSTHA